MGNKARHDGHSSTIKDEACRLPMVLVASISRI